ncbi:MAG: hypothetical protein K2Q10_07675, partial [Rhodospirillales bacterium]|nr:hypothetical protein [Rhodospirillales bacterium]
TLMGFGPLVKYFHREEQTAPAPGPERPHFSYLAMGTVSVPIVRQGGEPIRQIYFELQLEVPPAKIGEVENKRTKLQDEFIRDLYVFLPRYLSQHPSADPDVIKKRLMAVSTKVFGEGSVSNVLIKAAYER